MLNFLIRRALISVVTLVVISMVVYGILYLAPGDPLSGFANNPAVPPSRRAEIAENLGLNDPLHVQYSKWALAYVQGDWSNSYVSRSPAREVVLNRVPTTLMVVGSAFLLSLMIAIPVGVIAAIKQYSVFDQVSTTFAFLGFSLPTFFSGLIFIIVFSVKLDWLPFVFDTQVDGLWANFKQAIMPITVLALAGAAQLTRFVRASMLEVISQDYVRTSRAKGLKERTVIIAHAMRNAMIPVVTIIAIQIPEIFGGAIVTEQIFRVPGIGSLLIDSIESADVPVVMAIAFGIAILVVLFNILADLLYAVLDPRIKLS